MQHADDIKAAAQLGINLLGFDFIPKSPRYVRMISSQAGIIPDFSEERLRALKKPNTPHQQPPVKVGRVGVFADDMPQNIVTRVYNYELDYVQLNGEEPAVTLENLRRSIDPDIRKGIKIIKRIVVDTQADLAKATEYEGKADLLLFHITAKETELQATGDDNSPLNQLLSAYHGSTPFVISKPNAPFDTLLIKSITHPQFAGINLDTQFELEPGKKDLEQLQKYVEAVKAIK